MARPQPSDTDVLVLASFWSRWLVVATIVVVGGVSVLAPTVAPWVAMMIAATGFLAGVPHGAIDHLMVTRIFADRSVPKVVVAYAGLAVVVWMVLQWAGPAALLAVVVLSAVHFGLGELEIARALTGWRPNRVAAAAVVIAGCGALLLPLARSGEQWRTVATAISPELARIIGREPVQVMLAAAWTAAAVVAATAALRSGRNAVALDLALIGGLGMLAPPLTAFAVWFGGWHALRHTARIMTVEPGCAALLAQGRLHDSARRLVRLAALPSAAALVVVAALIWFTATANSPADVFAQILRVLLALTVPHMVVVFWLDRFSANKFELAA